VAQQDQIYLMQALAGLVVLDLLLLQLISRILI